MKDLFLINDYYEKVEDRIKNIKYGYKFLYFCGNHDLIKIGRSNNIADRIPTLFNVFNHESEPFTRVALIGPLLLDNIPLEKTLIKLFNDSTNFKPYKEKTKEWFIGNFEDSLKLAANLNLMEMDVVRISTPPIVRLSYYLDYSLKTLDLIDYPQLNDKMLVS